MFVIENLELEERFQSNKTNVTYGSPESEFKITNRIFDDAMSFGDENDLFTQVPKIEDMWQKKTVEMVNKKTDVKTEFTMYNEDALKYMHRPLRNDESLSIASYPMDKLEVEYDYETDEE